MERTRSRVYPRSARLIAQVGYTRLAMAPEGLRDPLWRSLAIGAGEAGEASRPRSEGRRLPALHHRQACAVCAHLPATTLYRATLADDPQTPHECVCQSAREQRYTSLGKKSIKGPWCYLVHRVAAALGPFRIFSLPCTHIVPRRGSKHMLTLRKTRLPTSERSDQCR